MRIYLIEVNDKAIKAFVNQKDAEDYYLKLNDKLRGNLIKLISSSRPKRRLISIPVDEDNTNFDKALLYNYIHAGSGSWAINVEYEDFPLGDSDWR